MRTRIGFVALAFALAVGILMSGFGTTLLAGGSTAEVTESYAYVTHVQVRENTVSIVVRGHFRSSHGCPNTPPWGTVKNGVDTESGKAMLSVALASFMARKEIRVTSDGCASGRPIILALDTEQS